MSINALIVDDPMLWGILETSALAGGASKGVRTVDDAARELKTGSYNILIVDPRVCSIQREFSDDYREVRRLLDGAKQQGIAVVVTTTGQGNIPKNQLYLRDYDSFFDKPYDTHELLNRLFQLTGTPIPEETARMFEALGVGETDSEQ